MDTVLTLAAALRAPQWWRLALAVVFCVSCGSSEPAAPMPTRDAGMEPGSYCGDGVVDDDEFCDDGAANGTYTNCASDCQTLGASCGDAVVDDDFGEICDDGNSVDTDGCLNNCTEAFCGDGVLWAGEEECDDGNQVNTDGCTNGCLVAPEGFARIEPGTFMMGSPAEEAGRDGDEVRHEVTLTRAFYLQAREVTQGQWEALMGNNPSYFSTSGAGAACGASCPVESVNWYEALSYANALSASEGLPECYTLSECTGAAGDGLSCTGAAVNTTGGNPYLCAGYRLPTEAEWEYAYRAGSETAFYNGGITYTDCTLDANLNAIGWYCGNAVETTHSVAQKLANVWDLYDMAGNVWEWAWDCRRDYAPPYTDPGPDSPSCNYRTIRGGAWDNPARISRAAYRNYTIPDDRRTNLGIRLARTVP